MKGIGNQGQRGNEEFKGASLQQSSVITLNRVAMTPKSRGSRKDSINNAVSAGIEESLKEDEGQPSNNGQSSRQPFMPINEDPRELDNNSWMMSQLENASMLQSQLQVDMTQEINKYFQQCSANIKEFQEYKGRFVLPANHRIKKMIKNGEVEVSNRCQALNFKEKERMRARKLKEQRRMVEMEKYEVIRKLKGIEQEEIELIHRNVKEHRNRSVEMKKIEYTPEENERIKVLVKNHKKFEKLLQEKTELYNLSVQAKRKEEQQARKRQKQTDNMVKKEQIAKKLKQINQKSQERKQSLKNSILKVQHQYVHKQLEKKFKSVQRLSKMQTEEKLKEISERHRLNIDQINQHDRKYTEHLQKRSQSLSSIKLEMTSSRKIQHSYFRKVIDQEMFELKQKNYQKQMKVKENEYKQKIMKYQQKVSKEFKPKVDPSLSIPIIPRTYSSVTLTNQERIEKGLEYLALAKEMRKSSEDITEPPKQVQNYGNKVYKDYLRERQPKNKDATQTQLKQIMSRKQANDFSSIQRAKYLSQALQAKSKKYGDAMLYHSAKAKLSLLSQLF